MNDAEPVTILLVDDQSSQLLTHEVMLRELGENLLTARSGREALDLLLKHEIAIIITDVHMPEINGFALATMIRQHPRYQQTAIFFISAMHLTESEMLQG
jgi:CheY-like chemotaxis protein